MSEECPVCGKVGNIDPPDDHYDTEFSTCSSCNEKFGICVSCKVNSQFIYMQSFHANSREWHDALEQEWKENNTQGRDLSECLDEQKIDEIIEKYPFCIKITEPAGENVSEKFRFPSFTLLVPYGVIKLGIDSTMSAESALVLVCNNCNHQEFDDICWTG